MLRIVLFTICIYGFCTSCKPVDRSSINQIIPVDTTYVSEQSQLAYDYGDQRNVDSLRSLLISRHSRENYQAVKTMYSFYDSTLLSPLTSFLTTDHPEIRSTTIYALGQSRDRKSLPDLMRLYRDTSLHDQVVRGQILETVGKIGGDEELKLLSSISTFNQKDTALLIGLSRGIYALQLKDHSSPEATGQLMSLVFPSGINEAQLYVAHYLGRAKELNLSPYEGKIREIALNHKNPEIRIGIARAFKHIQNDFGFQTLLDWFPKENDYRVRVEIIRALTRFKDRDIESFLHDASKDKNIHVQRTASKYLITRLSRGDALKMRQRMRNANDMDPVKRALLYASANRNLSNAYGITKVNMNDEIKEHATKQKNPYLKAQYLQALSYWPGNIDFLLDQYSKENHEIINTTILQSLLAICGSEEGKKTYSGYQGVLRQKIAKHFLKIFDQNNVGSMALASEAITKDPRQWKPYFRDLEFLTKSIERLDLPKEYETYLAVIKAINALNPSSNLKPEAIPTNHPIDWELFKELPDVVDADIETSRGTLSITLYPNAAPGSVTNWVQLARSDFFNDKYFHRVVSNFVVQSGCPRGDGYGSLDYTIRSEFNPLRYDRAGMIGMASAGPDTEATQWFITHSATPHLNGRYTIIGNVTAGLDVLHQIQQGDKVINVTIK